MRAIYLPCIFAVIIIITGTLPYGIAVSMGHVEAFLPFISDTGILIPERSIFQFSDQLRIICAYVKHFSTIQTS